MNFVKYNSIQTVTNKAILAFKNSSLYNPSDLWVVTPKIDGSNFTIMFDDEGNIVPAKRSSTIDMDASFFNFQRIFDKYNENAFHYMHQAIVYDYPSYEGTPILSVSFHGELCGGFYEGMPQLNYAKAVQKRVHYSNDTEFIMFDIRLWISDTAYYYMPHAKIVDYCDKYGIPVVPILFEGTLDKALAWSFDHNADPDTTWKIFGMPHEVSNNIREGHVIKPAVKTIFKGDSRMIFKDKNTIFKDREKKSKSGKVTNKTAIDYSDALMKLFEEVDDYITYNMFCSVTSKYGEYSIKNFGELMNLMVEDIYDELRRDGLADDLVEDDIPHLNKYLIKKVSAYFVANKKELF